MRPLLRGAASRSPTTTSQGNCPISRTTTWMLTLTTVALIWAYQNRDSLDGVRDVALLSSSMSTSTGNSYGNLYNNNDIVNPLAIPTYPAVNLPSLREGVASVDAQRSVYGGAGDAAHLGGFTELDLAGVSPAVWTAMLSNWGVRSLLDVGCGKGVSTSWFHLHGVRAMCVEGSHDAVTQSLIGSLDETAVVEHDFSRGPWWPAQTYDAAWAVEFLEHVGVNYQYNYVSAFRKAAILCVTSSRWGGWHHVEVHKDEWWIQKYEAYGFRYSESLTNQMRAVALAESRDKNATHVAPNGERYNAQHVWLTLKVFVNPVVAALPEHAHLFPEPGCFGTKENPNRECGTGKNGGLESTLPPLYKPLQPTAEQDEAWVNLVKQHITVKDKKNRNKRLL